LQWELDEKYIHRNNYLCKSGPPFASQIISPPARSSLRSDLSFTYLSMPDRAVITRGSALVCGDAYLYIHQAKTPQGNGPHIAETLQMPIIQDINLMELFV
jgi:hypothetical protein